MVSGQSQINDSTYEQVSILYSTNYLIIPQDTMPRPANLLFYPNLGQITDSQDSVRNDIFYYTINQSPKLYFQQDTVNFVLSNADLDTTTSDSMERISMTFLNGVMTDPFPITDPDTMQVLNYYLPQCGDGITNVQGVQSFAYVNVYDDIHVVFSNNKAGMRWQILVLSTGEPSQIVLHFEGQEQISLVNTYDLKVDGLLGSFTYKRPLAYQIDDLSGVRFPVGWLASYHILDSANVAITLGGSWNHDQVLALEFAKAESGGSLQDSGLCWSTYFGGTESEYGFSIATDGNDNVVIAGETQGSTFPFANGIQGFAGLEQCFLSKFNANDSLVYSTFWGGSNGENIAHDVKCNSGNHIFIGGFTTCTNFPLFNPTGCYFNSSNTGANGFLAEFDDFGQHVWSTYFGGRVHSIDFDSHDNLYVTGYAYSGAFPLDSVGGAYFQQSDGNWDAFITKFNTDDTIVWSTYYGGGANEWSYSIKVDSHNSVFLYGATKSSNFPCKNPGGLAFIDSTLGGTADDFIVKFDSTGIRKWASLVGGSDEEGLAFLSSAGPANRIAFDSGDNIYVVGTTNSSNFPLKHSTGFYDSTYAGRDGYVMKFSASNYSLQWGSYISGAGGMELESVAIGDNDKLLIGGGTADTAFYLHQQANLYYQDILKKDNHPSYSEDACIIGFDNQHNLIYGTYFGGYTGSGGEIIQDMVIRDGNKLFMSGMTSAVSNDFPLYDPGNGAFYDSTENGFFDVFVSELCIDQLIGIEEVANPKFPIELFPNPTSDQLTIGFQIDKNEKIGISVFNSIGQTVLQEDYKAVFGYNHVVLHTAALVEGFYFVTVTTNSGGACEKFMKFDR